MTVETSRLVRPDVAFRDSFLDALAESHAEGDDPGRQGPQGDEDFGEFVKRLLLMDAPSAVPDDRVPQTPFWLVDGDAYIGRLSLRHHLNDRLRLIGGHIGYDIRPSMRRRGYGTRALALGLHEARKLGLTRVLINCDKENTGSRRIIESNGGVLENETTIPDYAGVILQYWITL